MRKLDEGDLSGVPISVDCFIPVRGSVVESNVRGTEDYKDRCCEAVGLGKVVDVARYAHLAGGASREERQRREEARMEAAFAASEFLAGADTLDGIGQLDLADMDNVALLRWVVRRGSDCMCLPESPRTTVKGYKHRLVTRGPPVRVGLHRLSRPDSELVERAIQEDVDRGQLRRGYSPWGFPAFITKESAQYKAIRRKRRLVVDYRELNRVTVRKFFIIPNSDGMKATVAGSRYISVGDLKEGFNQVDNEPETSMKMAVLSVTGSYLPRGLTFGPVNGPEDFQGLVFEVFARRLYKDHFIFIDDLAVATGRKPCRPQGPARSPTL